MGLNISAAPSGKRRHRRAAVMSEINVTPMVDVMLVLLIIFMVAAPLMTMNIQIDLPEASGGSNAKNDSVPLAVSVKRTSGTCNSKVEIFLGDTAIDSADLESKIKAIRGSKSDAESNVFLRGDRDVCYTDVMKVLGRVRAAGYRVNVVILPEQGS